MAAKKLVHKHNSTSVKDNDHVDTEEFGQVIVKSIMQPRKKHGSGRVRVTLPDGRVVDLPPGAVKAKWV